MNGNCKYFKYNQWSISLEKRKTVDGDEYISIDILGNYNRYNGIYYGVNPDTHMLYDYVAYDFPECISKGLKDKILKCCIKMMSNQ